MFVMIAFVTIVTMTVTESITVLKRALVFIVASTAQISRRFCCEIFIIVFIKVFQLLCRKDSKV